MRRHHTLILWSGLLFLIFLLWAWQASTAHSRSLSIYRGAIAAGFTTESSSVSIRIRHNRAISISLSLDLTGPTPVSNRSEQSIFPAPHFYTMEMGQFKLLSLSIPYWLLILLHGTLWIGLLLWFSRRPAKILQIP